MASLTGNGGYFQHVVGWNIIFGLQDLIRHDKEWTFKQMGQCPSSPTEGKVGHF